MGYLNNDFERDYPDGNRRYRLMRIGTEITVTERQSGESASNARPVPASNLPEKIRRHYRTLISGGIPAIDARY